MSADCLYRGDCLDILPTLPEAGVQLVVTSPPYNVGWDYADDGSGDRRPLAEYQAMLAAALDGCRRVLRPGGVLALNLPPTIRQPEGRAWPIAAWAHMHLLSEGWLMREPIAWVKSCRPRHPDPDSEGWQPWAPGTAIGAASNPYLRATWELVVLASKADYAIPGKKAWPADSLDWLKDVWPLPPGRSQRGEGEPTAFPTELVRRLIALFSEPGDVVLDPFAGSGTVARMARAMGRTAWLVEREPSYWPRLEAIVGQTMMDFAGAAEERGR